MNYMVYILLGRGLDSASDQASVLNYFFKGVELDCNKIVKFRIGFAHKFNLIIY